MTKKEIVKAISEELGLTQLKTKEIVQKTFDAIVETLVRDGRIELRNFGVFEVRTRAPRKARNPRTGEKVFVPAKNVVTFKPGKEMEEQVRHAVGDFAPLDDSASRPAAPAAETPPAAPVEQQAIQSPAVAPAAPTQPQTPPPSSPSTDMS